MTMVTRERPIVLLVDDDKAFREAVSEIFSTLKYKVDVASTFDGAIRTIHNHPLAPMVAFIDIHLKGVNSGLDLLDYIRHTAKHRVMAYACTGDDSITVHREALRAGAIRLFVKSKDPLELLPIYVECSQAFEVANEAGKDLLTGLDNYQGFRRSVLGLLKLAKKRGRPEVFSLLSIDVDRFKIINDTQGHLLGDRVLQEIARTLRQHVRPADHLCRKSGDEFLILLPDFNQEAAIEFGNRLQAEVGKVHVTKDEWLRVLFSISFGVSEIRHTEIEETEEDVLPEESLDQLLELADTSSEGLIARRARVRGVSAPERTE
ncbi:MAG: hypothetical protein A3A26_01215 [Candidatus Zambryskibacteria bacterium RIFCSPLOWO2_01_FULL_47_14]|uniref:GGDEF domain-containing protein n=2 Tax=Candidatus Zambryskiibacteriota TaxID=1817925 RepID=A0A1G2U9K8_9BACT|nr:MAG: hypothetical protein A3A26_01215 [Candidatus Zambryskibacteria bacterium RIFCSPLOWO2_01_FULL_47_14]